MVGTTAESMWPAVPSKADCALGAETVLGPAIRPRQPFRARFV